MSVDVRIMNVSRSESDRGAWNFTFQGFEIKFTVYYLMTIIYLFDLSCTVRSIGVK